MTQMTLDLPAPESGIFDRSVLRPIDWNAGEQDRYDIQPEEIIYLPSGATRAGRDWIHARASIELLEYRQDQWLFGTRWHLPNSGCLFGVWMGEKALAAPDRRTAIAAAVDQIDRSLPSRERDPTCDIRAAEKIREWMRKISPDGRGATIVMQSNWPRISRR